MCGGTSVPVRYRGGKSWPSSLVLGALGFTTARTVRPAPTLSPPLGAERAGVRWGIPERSPTPTSPSQRFALGPSLSPLKGGEGLLGIGASHETPHSRPLRLPADHQAAGL